MRFIAVICCNLHSELLQEAGVNACMIIFCCSVEISAILDELVYLFCFIYVLEVMPRCGWDLDKLGSQSWKVLI